MRLIRGNAPTVYEERVRPLDLASVRGRLDWVEDFILDLNSFMWNRYKEIHQPVNPTFFLKITYKEYHEVTLDFHDLLH